MPTYDYRCEACGHEFEQFQSMAANPLKKCPQCSKMKLRRLIGAGPELAGLATVYLATLVVFYPIATASDTAEYAYTAVGDSRAGLHINVLTAAINFVLDPFLIFGWWVFPRLGVQGAAVATGVGIVLALAVGLAFALGLRDSFRFTADAVGFEPSLAREILSVGAPLCGQRTAGQVVRVLVVGLVAVAGGAPGVAAYTVGARVASLAIIPAQGLQQAAQSMIGQNLGADRPDRAFRTTTVGVGIAFAALALLGVVQWFVPELIVNALVPDLTARGRELTVLYLRILALSYWALGVTYVLLAGFNGASRTKTSFVVDLLKYWGVRFPIAVLAVPTAASFGAFGVAVSPGFGWGVEAILWAVTVSNVVAALGVAVYFAYTARDGMFARAADGASDSAPGD